MNRRTLALVAITAALSSCLSLIAFQVLSPPRVDAASSAPSHKSIDAQLRKLNASVGAVAKRVDRVHRRAYDNCLHIIFLENEVREHAGGAKFANPVDAAKASCVVGNYVLSDGYDPDRDAPGTPTP